MVEGRICREEDPRWHRDVPIRREAIPVRYGNALLAVLSRDANLASPGCRARWRSPTWPAPPTSAR